MSTTRRHRCRNQYWRCHVQRPVLGAELVLKRAVHGDRHVCRRRSLDVGRARRGTGRSWGPTGAGRPGGQSGSAIRRADVIEVADATSQPVKDVAALHFRLGSRLHLHWLRDRIADLSREDRWQEMARAALRDDLFSLHGELTADVLHGSPALRELRNLIQSTVPVSDEPASPEGLPAPARAAAWR